ncbi:MAG TPA: DsbA family protein [Bryobacteraceae bacterium]|nr:DsbA family protein [Bryobacteraceae bacterium]
MTDLADADVDPKELERQQQEFMENLTRGDPPTLGPRNAPATIVVFSDFQCPYCSRLAQTLRNVSSAEPSSIRVVYHYFPLSIHRWAREAAESAACAKRQSNEAFWRVHDFLFAHQAELSHENLRKQLFEGDAPISPESQDRVKACIQNHTAAGEIEQNMALGEEIGVHATPTLFLNGELIKNSGPEELRRIIDQAHSRAVGR